MAFGYLAQSQAKLGVAVSGGSDSLALLMLAADYCQASGATCFAVTVDHGLRPEAREEARLVSTICGQLGVGHTTLEWRRADGGSPVSQEAARDARHRLMAEWAAGLGIRQLALGHTRDDRLETFLMRARQGSGWRGLAGLMPNACSPAWPEGRDLCLVRPLLAFGREELREELRARDVAWSDDPSNESGKYERVRMRRLLLRMDKVAQQKALKVMDRLAQMRASVAQEACSLLKAVRIYDDGRQASLPLKAGEGVSRESWRRLVEAHVMAAGGSERPPRREALDRLIERIAGRAPELDRGVTLAGAKIRMRKEALSFARAPARRGTPDAGTPDWGRAGMLLTVPDLRVLAV